MQKGSLRPEQSHLARLTMIDWTMIDMKDENATPRRLIVLTAILAASLISAPIFAQRGDGANRPSRQCIQEIVKLCGRDRSAIPACLQSKADQLSSQCQSEVRQRAQGRRQDSGNTATFQRSMKPTSSIIYGPERRQQIDIFEPEDAVDNLPLILFIHGGGWSMGSHKLVQQKPVHFTSTNHFFASAGYRVLPAAPVEEQASDVGKALQALVGQASAIGFDPGRIVIMGHSAGAHLAALVSSDPQYAGDAFDAIKGVVLLDGAGYDVAARMERARARMSSVSGSQTLNLYRDVFGESVDRQRELSPISHVGERDAPNWLALFVDSRQDAKVQAETLVESLTSAGADARALAISNSDHGRMNRELGTPAGQQQTQAVDAFLAEILE